MLGREKDIIFLDDFTRVSLKAFILGQHSKEFELIIEFQLYHDKPGELLLRIRPSQSFTNKDIDSIINTLNNSVGNRLKIKVIIVEEIEKTQRGKQKFLIQNYKT